MSSTDRGFVAIFANFSEMDNEFFSTYIRVTVQKGLVKTGKTKNQDHFTRRRFLNHQSTCDIFGIKGTVQRDGSSRK
jgi:hypothetical protein